MALLLEVLLVQEVKLLVAAQTLFGTEQWKIERGVDWSSFSLRPLGAVWGGSWLHFPPLTYLTVGVAKRGKEAERKFTEKIMEQEQETQEEDEGEEAELQEDEE